MPRTARQVARLGRSKEGLCRCLRDKVRPASRLGGAVPAVPSQPPQEHMRLCCRAEFTPATDLERAPDQGGRLGRASSPALVGRRHRPPSCTLHPVTDSPPLSGCARPPFNREVRCPSQGNQGPEPSAHCQPTPGLHEPCPEAVITPTPKPVPKRKWVSLRAEGTWLLMAQFQASAVSGEKVAGSFHTTPELRGDPRP